MHLPQAITVIIFALILPSKCGGNFIGYRVEPTSPGQLGKLEFEAKSGAFRIPRGFKFRLRLYGTNMSSFTNLAFAKRLPISNNNSSSVVYCDDLGHTTPFRLTKDADSDDFTTADDLFFSTEWMTNDVSYYFCLEQNGNDEYIFQGDKQSIVVYHMQPYIFPLPFELIAMLCCLSLSWLFSGLNLGLMSLDCTELQLLTRCGTKEEARFAKAIQPIRRRGNTLLCTILLANTIVNSSYTLLLDDVIGEGIYALIGSTVGIVIFGEILPQAVCSHYGLKVGYYARWIIMGFMYALYPLTFTIGKLLDLIFGREIHQMYSREKLREIVMMTGEEMLQSAIKADDEEHLLKREEIKILTGALQMNETTVHDIMKGRHDILMLDIKESISYDLIALVSRSGFSRIPVYANGDIDNIVGILYSTDLLGIDPERKMPLNSLVEYYSREVIRVEEDRTILAMLNTFKEAKVHVAIVDRVENGHDHRVSKRSIAGVVTLEDIIEFILREKIVDEKKVLQEIHDGAIAEKMTERSEIIPQQLCMAATQFLMANVKPFRKEIVERRVLALFLRFPGLFVIKKYNATVPTENLLYALNKPANFFTLILQGTCNVNIGREHMSFEAGPFHVFGLEALSPPSGENHHLENGESDGASKVVVGSLTSISPAYLVEMTAFRPDFTVEITSDFQYIRLTHAMYRALTSVTRVARAMKKCDDQLFLVEKLTLEMKQGHGGPTSMQQPTTQPEVKITNTPISPVPRLVGQVSCYPALPQYHSENDNNISLMRYLLPSRASQTSSTRTSQASLTLQPPRRVSKA